MNIDHMISKFDFDKSKSDCLIHDFLKTYIKMESHLSTCENNEADRLEKQLNNYSDNLEQLLECAMCFPSGCEDCVGMQKCIDCINQDNLASSFVKLKRYMENGA